MNGNDSFLCNLHKEFLGDTVGEWSREELKPDDEAAQTVQRNRLPARRDEKPGYANGGRIPSRSLFQWNMSLKGKRHSSRR
jgi:hypothetical protein